jgi:hypothetical protein
VRQKSLKHAIDYQGELTDQIEALVIADVGQRIVLEKVRLDAHDKWEAPFLCRPSYISQQDSQWFEPIASPLKNAVVSHALWSLSLFPGSALALPHNCCDPPQLESSFSEVFSKPMVLGFEAANALVKLIVLAKDPLNLLESA